MTMIRYSRFTLPLFIAILSWVIVEPVFVAAQLQPPRPYRRGRQRAMESSSSTIPLAAKKPQEDKPNDRYFAVTGATVHTVSGPTLADSTILCKNGKIVAIGRGVVIPEDAETLDAAGFHLYPGLIAVRSRGLVGSEPPDNSTDVFGLYLTLGLAGGITTAVTGNTAAKLSYGTLDDHVIKRKLFDTLSYSRRSPSSRLKFRKTLERVRQYLRDLQAYEEEKTKNPQAKEPDKSWLKSEYEAALKLLRHETTAIAEADSAQDLRDLAQLAEQYGFRLVVHGASEGWIVAPELARAGVRAIVTPRTRRDPDERLNRPNGSSIENARILHDHGVLLAIEPLGAQISMSGLAGRDLLNLPMEAAFAIRGGLSADAAVRAITLDAARILGIDHRVGSIEVGKDADFAIVDGDLLHYMTLVRWTVVNGRIAYDKQKEKLLDHIRPGGDLNAPPPIDYWPRSLGEPVSGAPDPPTNK